VFPKNIKTQNFSFLPDKYLTKNQFFIHIPHTPDSSLIPTDIAPQARVGTRAVKRNRATQLLIISRL
jgi:hypothetical protein